jgi:regulator of extracellular matrix RemA (YlzA/DUF370 family)
MLDDAENGRRNRAVIETTISRISKSAPGVRCNDLAKDFLHKNTDDGQKKDHS